MHVWLAWIDALEWCNKNAMEDCMVVAKDWFEAVPGETRVGLPARLKYESNSRCFFLRGTH